MKLDYTLQTPEERNELVKQIINNTPQEQLTPRYLEILANYILMAEKKQKQKQKNILTDNRYVTINKRETSFEGLATQLEGEDGIYGLIANDKDILFTPKISITEADIKNVPGLKELRESIAQVEIQFRAATGKRKYSLKKQLIQMRQDQYVLKNTYYPYATYARGPHFLASLDLDETISLDDRSEPQSDCLINLLNPAHVSALLCHYSALKEEVYDKLDSDLHYLMMDLENLIDKTLKEAYPLYFDLLVYKIDGKQNMEIQKLLADKHNITYSPEYLSSLWRKKIPKLIANQAQEDALMWYYTTQEYGKWKRCSRCGQIKLSHNRFFSKNKTSRDGFYSICKQCRNRKKV